MAITVSAGNGTMFKEKSISDGTNEVLHATKESERYAFLKILADIAAILITKGCAVNENCRRIPPEARTGVGTKGKRTGKITGAVFSDRGNSRSRSQTQGLLPLSR